MTRRTFQRVPVRRADFGPTQPGYRITCGACRTTDEVIVKGTLDDVGTRFRAGGWLVGPREADDRCPSCNPARRPPSRKELPMVKTDPPPSSSVPTLSVDAILQRKVVYDTLFEVIDADHRRFKAGWSEARVAAETKMAPAFVTKFLQENFGPIAPAPVPAGERARAVTAGLVADLADLHKASAAVTSAVAALEAAERDLLAIEARIAARVADLQTATKG